MAGKVSVGKTEKKPTLTSHRAGQQEKNCSD
jgi:hypothetical protein